jgi:hypothetical protein
MDRQPTPDMSVGNALTGWQGKRRAPTHRAAKSGPSSNLLASQAMSQRSGPGFATAQTNSALSLAQRTGDARIESSTLEGQGVLAEGFQLGRGEAGVGAWGGIPLREAVAWTMLQLRSATRKPSSWCSTPPARAPGESALYASLKVG